MKRLALHVVDQIWDLFDFSFSPIWDLYQSILPSFQTLLDDMVSTLNAYAAVLPFLGLAKAAAYNPTHYAPGTSPNLAFGSLSDGQEVQADVEL